MVGQNALLRFYVLHCMAIPVVFSFLVAIHFWRIRKDGGISCRTTPEPCTVPAVSGSAPAQTAAEPVKSNGGRYRLLAYVRGETYSGKRDLAADEVSGLAAPGGPRVPGRD